MKRLRKFRNKNRPYVFCMKLGLIFYSFAFSILYLTGNTGAYFNDAASVNGFIQAGTWWDKSSLTFVTNNKQPVKKGECTPINATIKNGGDGDMQGTVNYEVWWAEKGNPKDGVKVSGGEINALKRGESLGLSYASDNDGNYKFKAYQSTGHPGQGELWSDDITVNCSDSKSAEETQENNSDTEKVEEDSEVPEQKPEQEQEQPNEPVTPETPEDTTEETTEQVPETQTGETGNEETTEETPITTPDPQQVEENETQKDGTK
ncbi:amyloid fiber anchoring/assembly protein TapA [Fictibacillus barbaricus]|uniref:amyloid fiber anchoring/assembly protein TapA n=1 Tax=Fictibacillus barbaricus TaxID=182136 RepID=UPI00227A0473|nr:amyloid fiber anchoring/assembly protein TapA [Fictibacillus barbaricus]